MPGQDPPLPEADVALTIAECQSSATRFQFLNLASTYLRSIPEELCKLRHLTSINLSDNPISEFRPETGLPQQLAELNITACDLSALPRALALLPNLKKLHAGTNSITDTDVIFECQSLQLAGLCYNRISSLPASVPVTCSIISLDLSHNDITDLASTLHKLQLLPLLRILSLSGNPVSLLPHYDTTTRAVMKSLKFFDGTKLDTLGQGSNSRAGTASQQQAAPSIPSFQTTGCDTYLHLQLTELQPSEDPFKEVRAMYELLAAAAEGSERPGAAGAAAEAQPAAGKLPLQPVEYHVELTDVDGTSYGSLPLILQPPPPPVIEPPTKDKQKPKPVPGKAEKVEAPPAPRLLRGSLSVRLGIRANVQWRDWLRRGIEVKIICTTHTSVARPLTEEELEAQKRAQTPPGKAGKGKGKDQQEPPPPPPFDVVTSQEVYGVAVIKCSALVSGHSSTYEAAADFIPVPSLWDDRGIRMAVDDERHPVKPAARVRVKLQLHSELQTPV